MSFRWLLDTRPIWANADSSDPEFLKALHLIPLADQTAVRKYIHASDRKLSLGSHLLKRLAVVKTYSSTPWSEVVFTADENRKPCYCPQRVYSDESEDANQKPKLQFNVSHQAGLVALIGSQSSGTLSQSQVQQQCGIDIVCVNERDDHNAVRKAGSFTAWVDMFAEVFSAREMDNIRCGPEYLEQSGAMNEKESEKEVLDMKLRLFYAHWCLKEAYIKMQGEALLADWLQELEFRDVRAPRPSPPSSSTLGKDAWGEVVSDFSIWRAGKKVEGVKMELCAFEERFMIATAVASMPSTSTSTASTNMSFPPFQVLDVEKDIYPYAGRK
ncbi:MAG: hypothetical protein M1819_006766 [Sarea resinae]|nr:MAG: hypothetical protein M1819_006766 [Sarea resinae]